MASGSRHRRRGRGGRPDWRRSLQSLEGSAEQAQGTAALDHFEFALRDDALASGVGKSRAAARLERFRAEDLLRDGISTIGINRLAGIDYPLWAKKAPPPPA